MDIGYWIDGYWILDGYWIFISIDGYWEDFLHFFLIKVNFDEMV